MSEEKEILCNALASLNEALNYFNELEDDEAHADIYWEIKDVSDVLVKRIQCVASGEVE
jgi:hypothetical protein